MNVFSRSRTLNAMSHRIGALWLSLVFPLCFCCCNATRSDSTKNAVVTQESTSAKQSPTHNTNDPLSPEMSKTVLGQVWSRFVREGRYRLATRDDFDFPHWAAKARLLPRQEDIDVPFISSWIGYAAIVVDVSRNDPQRFGLVIVTTDEGANEGANQKNVIHWFCRNKDLSHSVLSTSSGRLYLTQFEERASYTTCDIGWDDQKGKYECKKRYKVDDPAGTNAR
jgi:hypothetical protein